MSHEVFISYAIEDKSVADAVCQALEVQGVRCWYAPRDVPYGAIWQEAVIDAISESLLVILVLSSHANKSPQVKRKVMTYLFSGLLAILIVFAGSRLLYHLGAGSVPSALKPLVNVWSKTGMDARWVNVVMWLLFALIASCMLTFLLFPFLYVRR